MTLNIEKQFTEGFLDDLSDLYKVCKDNNTKYLTINIPVDNRSILVARIRFEIKEIGVKHIKKMR